MQLTATFDETQKDQILQNLLQQKADAMGLTIDEYITQMVNAWIAGQVRGHYEQKTRDMTIAELYQLFGGF